MTPAVESAARLRRYLVANIVGVGFSVVLLGVFGVALLRSAHLTVILVILVIAALVQVGGVRMLTRGRADIAASSLVVSSWLAALGGTYVSPFIVPVAVLIVVIPVVVVFDFLRGAALRAGLVGTVLFAGVVAYLGHSRHGMPDALEPDPPVAAAITVVFTMVVAVVLTLGMAQQVARLRRQATELAGSRRRLAVASDEARRAIERDLHDGAQQRLVTLSVELGRVTRLVERDPTAAVQSLGAIHAQLHEAIKELRDLAHGIYPPLLVERGLTSALSAAGRRCTLPCTVEIVDLPRYAAEVESAVYFSCLEAMHNADKHSRGSQIVVQARGPAPLEFSVTDDGAGFDTSAPSGTGLTGMLDRVRAAGGKVAVTSTRPGGTVVYGRFDDAVPRDAAPAKTDPRT